MWEKGCLVRLVLAHIVPSGSLGLVGAGGPRGEQTGPLARDLGGGGLALPRARSMRLRAGEAKDHAKEAAMAALFEKILCPVDFDDNSRAAVDYARDLAVRSGGKLFLVHIIVPIPPPPDLPVEPYPPGSVDQAKARLERMAKERLEGKVPYECCVKVGVPAVEISSTAAEVGAQLIVMATHGRRGLAHFVLGSVAERVVRESRVPVLTIRAGG